MPSWKVVQTKRKSKQNLKLGILILSVIVLFIFFAQIFKFSKALLSPWKSSNIQNNYSWNSEFNINLLFRSKGIALVSYNPTDQKIIIVNIPDETYLTASLGFGDWLLGSIFDLGGDKLLKDTLRDFLGQPIDGLLDFSGEYKDKTAKEIVDIIRSSPLPFGILSNLKTELTLWELIKFKQGLSSVRFDKLNEIDLKKTNALSKDHLLDGTEILLADPAILDTILIELTDPKIKNEHKTITIFNATEKPLFAQKWARLITNIGGNVIIMTNSEIKSDKTIVIGEKGDSLKRLQQIFNFVCPNKDCDKISKEDEHMTSSRGQINVKLGLDLVN